MNIPQLKPNIIEINGSTRKQLLHQHFEVWQKLIINNYSPMSGRVALFIPCSATKPYYNSPIHKEINSVVRSDVHKIVVSSAGVVPYEFADYYPFNAYDWNPLSETDEIRDLYIEVTTYRLSNYLQAHKDAYTKFVSYLHPESCTFKSLLRACKNESIDLHAVDVKNIELPPTADQDLALTVPTNIKRLEEVLGS